MMPTLIAAILLGQAQDPPRSYVAGTAQIHVDGVYGGTLKSWEGGDVRCDVVVERAGADRISKKHIAQPRYAPIVVRMAVQPGQPILEWMAEMLTGKVFRRSIVISTSNYNAQPLHALKGLNCALTQIVFPRPEGGSKDADYLRLTFTPELTQAVAPLPAVPVPAGNVAKIWIPQNFRFQVDGLDCSKVSRIEELTISSQVAQDAVGAQRDVRMEPGALVVPHVVVTLAEMSAAAWKAWHEDFAVKGNNGDDKEKNGSLEFLSSNRTEVLLSLRFRNLGIAGLSRAPQESNGDAFPMVRAELYCERIELAPPLLTALPVGVLVVPAVPVAPPVAAGDQGPRDLADFPRPEGLVRKSYVSSRQKTGSTETVAYSSKSPIEKVEVAYERLLKDAEWESTNRFETGDKSSQVLVIAWRKAARTAQVTFAPSKDGGSEIVVSVTERK